MCAAHQGVLWIIIAFARACRGREAQAATHARLEKYLHSPVYVDVAAADLLHVLQEVRKAQAANRARLDEEYRRLVGNLVEAQQLQGGEEWLANPALPEDIVRESMPGGPVFLLEVYRRLLVHVPGWQVGA
jgi:hypothetical protein